MSFINFTYARHKHVRMTYLYVYTVHSAMHPNIVATFLCINIYMYKYLVCMCHICMI